MFTKQRWSTDSFNINHVNIHYSEPAPSADIHRKQSGQFESETGNRYDSNYLFPAHVSHVSNMCRTCEDRIIQPIGDCRRYSTNIAGRNQVKVAVTGPRIAPDRSSASTRHNQPSATSSFQDLGIEIRISSRFEESRRNSSTFT